MAAAGAAPVPAFQGGGTDLLALELTFLSPLGALACLAAVLPVAALVHARRRAGRAADAIGLPESSRGRGRLLLLAAACCAFGLAAAQPAVSRDGGREVRSDVEALFVVDVSRSMLAAAGPDDATRLERARAAALKLRATIPEVRSGLAGLTDRALPYLFPTLDQRVFASTLQEAAMIESPPPQQVARVATSFDALTGLGSGASSPRRSGGGSAWSSPTARARRSQRRPRAASSSSSSSGTLRSASIATARRSPSTARTMRRPRMRPGSGLSHVRETSGAPASCWPPRWAMARSRRRPAAARTTTLLAPYIAFAGLVLVLVLVFGPPHLLRRRVSTIVEA